jgi:hypothetical protein
LSRQPSGGRGASGNRGSGVKPKRQRRADGRRPADKRLNSSGHRAVWTRRHRRSFGRSPCARAQHDAARGVAVDSKPACSSRRGRSPFLRSRDAKPYSEDYCRGTGRGIRHRTQTAYRSRNNAANAPLAGRRRSAGCTALPNLLRLSVLSSSS